MQLKDIHKKYYAQIPEAEFWEIVQADPTYDGVGHPQKKGKYTQWLLHAYKKGVIASDSLIECAFLLGVFHRYRQLLTEKDIIKYDTLQKLRDTLYPYLDDPYAEVHETSKAMRIRKIKEGAEKVYEDEEWAVFVPHTWEASRYYGKGTLWCTAYDRNSSYFIQYNSKGPLYININRKTKKKWQFHFETLTFCDEKDCIVDLEETLLEMTPGVQQFYSKIMNREHLQHTWHTFSEAWAAWLNEDCRTEVDFSVCDQPDGEVFTPSPMPGNVTSVRNMFSGCHRLRSINLSRWNVQGITDFHGMFRMCDHLESIDLSNWQLPAIADVSEMFLFCNDLRKIIMYDCSVETIRAVLISCRNLPGVKLELSPETPEHALYDSLVNDLVAMSAELEQGFWKLHIGADVDTVFSAVREIAAIERSIKKNPLFAGVEFPELKDFVAKTLDYIYKILTKVHTFTFSTRKVGFLLLSRPNIEAYICQKNKYREEVNYAVNILDCIDKYWGAGNIGEEVLRFRAIVHRILSQGECTKSVALKDLREIGFRNRTYIAIPWLSAKMERWTGNVRSGASHLRMSNAIRTLLILAILCTPLMLLLAFVPHIGAVMIILAVLNFFQDEKFEEALKLSLFYTVMIGVLTAFSWFVVRPAALCLIGSDTDEQEQTCTESVDFRSYDSSLDEPYILTPINSVPLFDDNPAEEEQENNSSSHIAENTSDRLTVCGQTLSAEDVMLARKDTIPFGGHVLSDGRTIAEWCVDAMKEDYKQTHEGNDYSLATLDKLQKLICKDLNQKNEKELRLVVKANLLTMAMSSIAESNEIAKSLKLIESNN